MPSPVELVVLLWSLPGRAVALTEYEDRVLAWVPDHEGRVVQRARGEGSDDAPDEVQFIAFPSEDSLEAYLADPRRLALSEVRHQAIARTQILRMRFS